MTTEDIEPTPPHPDAVLAVHLGDEEDPIPLRPGPVGPIQTTPLEPAREPALEGSTSESLPALPGAQAAPLALVQALEARVEALDDDMGSCLEDHNAILRSHEVSLRAHEAMLSTLWTAHKARQLSATEALQNKLTYARRAMQLAVEAIQDGDKLLKQSCIEAEELLTAALEETDDG